MVNNGKTDLSEWEERRTRLEPMRETRERGTGMEEGEQWKGISKEKKRPRECEIEGR